jgi:hypothetical protein
MKRICIFVLLAVVPSSGCFWGFRGPRSREGEYRRDDRRGHDERDHGHGDHGRDRDHDHREGR